MTPDTFAKIPHSLLVRRDLTATAKVVYAVVVGRIGENGESWPGMRRIAMDTGIEVKAAMRAIGALRKAGLLEVVGRGDRGTFKYRPGSAPKMVALPKRERSPNGNSSAPQMVSPRAPKKGTESDPVNKIHELDPRARASARTPGHAELTAFWGAEWSKRNGGTKYPHGGVKDGKAVNRMMAALDGDVARVKDIMLRFLDDSDAFYQKTGKTLAMCQTRMAAYLAKPGSNGHRRSLSDDTGYEQLLSSTA